MLKSKLFFWVSGISTVLCAISIYFFMNSGLQSKPYAIAMLSTMIVAAVFFFLYIWKKDAEERVTLQFKYEYFQELSFALGVSVVSGAIVLVVTAGNTTAVKILFTLGFALISVGTYFRAQKYRLRAALEEADLITKKKQRK